MAEFVFEVATRLPLAEATLRLLGFVCEDEFLDNLFERFRGRSYQDAIRFPVFIRLIADALVQHHGSGRQSFQRAEEDGVLAASVRAVYGKLSRVPLSLSIGLLSETSARLKEVWPERVVGRELPAVLKEFADIFFHDGKTIKHVEKRLKVLRNFQSKVLGGRLVVAQSYSTGMAAAMGADEDGESAEQPLVPSVLEQVRRHTSGSILHVADRQYCDLIQAERFAAERALGARDHFLVRWCRKVSFVRDTDRETRTGVDRYGREFTEDWGWMGAASARRRRHVRRIHLHRPGKQEDVVLLTDLEDANKYPADDLLEVYLQRWGIERMFQQVTEVFQLQTLIGTTPRATVFQASFCLLMHNVIQVIRAYIAEKEQRNVHTISGEQLFYDVRRQLTAWHELLDTLQTLKYLATTWKVPQVSHRLRKLLHGQWSDRWTKTPSNTHKLPPTKGKAYTDGGHNSVYRIMQVAREGAG